ncbi:hypothetical protein ELS17_04320 [Natrinema altunense]|uniref:Uncharacterized protein n=1 Tax=Natrinema altunense TaxID=222984 RepID=A0A482Y1E6_9EURY|nr:hypothetical protein ELS17_04320 [Natrinema altunense]
MRVGRAGVIDIVEGRRRRIRLDGDDAALAEFREPLPELVLADIGADPRFELGDRERTAGPLSASPRRRGVV